MTDIVERLRDRSMNDDWQVVVSEAHEAAAEIERLRAALRLAQRGLNPYATYETQLEARVVVDGICAALGERT